MDFRPLTVRQQEVYDYIKIYIEENHFPPSVRDICDGTLLSSTSSVHRYLEILEQKGYIVRMKNRTRAIKLVTVEEALKDVEEKMGQGKKVLSADFVVSLLQNIADELKEEEAK
ncbi:MULTISPECIES: LexA family transcriptional regulator [Bacillus]|uniref:LexA family protein n=1 Tax=Bacillus TaxID=1386 RepID=UPI0016426077|nr:MULTISPECIES: hypothetical protein [Bacillus]